MLDPAATLFAMALLAGPQSAKPVEADAKITNVAWIRPPDPNAVSQYMPPFALMIGVSGQVDLRCSVHFEGPPQHCQAVSETPDGLGFEDAAQLVAATGVLAPGLVDGVPYPAFLVFRVTFSAEPIPERPVAPYEGPEPSARALSLARQVLRTLANSEGFARHRAERQDWTTVLEDLPSDRQATVAGWLDELFPYDESEDFERGALALARLTAEADLEAYLKTGAIPPPPPSAFTMAQAYGADDAKMLKALSTLRERYCSRWDCRVSPD